MTHEIPEASYKEIVKHTNVISTIDRWFRVKTVEPNRSNRAMYTGIIEFWMTAIQYIYIETKEEKEKEDG